MGIYTHAQTEQVKVAINDLPDFQKQTQIMTGTDGDIFTPCYTPDLMSKTGANCLGLAKKTCDIVKSKTADISSKTAILAEKLG